MSCTPKIYRCINVASSGIRHDCLHDVIIVFTRAAIDNELSPAGRKKQLYEIVRNSRNAGKTVCALALESVSTGNLPRDTDKQNASVHLQGSYRYRRSMPCSRRRLARTIGREVSRIASRIRHSNYSNRRDTNLSLGMRRSSVSPPSRESPHDRTPPF